MPHDHNGFWSGDSSCEIELHRRSDGKTVFPGTVLADNPGTSATNYAEHLATAMRK